MLNESNIPFREENSIFTHKLFDCSDNEYFKFIRACFAAHPVNLDDFCRIKGQKSNRKWFASWSGGGFGDGDFSVILSSNIPYEADKFVDIYFEELLLYAQLRYKYLDHIWQEIEKQEATFVKKMARQKIAFSDVPLEMIAILLKESIVRLNNDYYNQELNVLYMVFSTLVNGSENQALVDDYKTILLSEIYEIYSNLQAMTINDLIVDTHSLFSIPNSLHYAYGKLYEYVFCDNQMYSCFCNQFVAYFEGIIDFSQVTSKEEFLILVNAGLHAKLGK